MTTINFCGRHGFKAGESTLIGEEYFIVTSTTETTLTVRNIFWYELLFTRALNRIKKAVRSNKKKLKDLVKRAPPAEATNDEFTMEPNEELKDMAFTVVLTIAAVMCLSVTPAIGVLIYFKFWGGQ